MGRRRVKKGEDEWRNCNSKVWNNEEKKSQKGREMIGRRVTVRRGRRKAQKKKKIMRRRIGKR